MAQEYLDRLSALMDRVTPGGIKGVKLECKHFFSGAAVYANGRICLSWTPVGFAVKLPAAARNALINRWGAKHLRYFPKGPIKKEGLREVVWVIFDHFQRTGNMHVSILSRRYSSSRRPYARRWMTRILLFSPSTKPSETLFSGWQ